MARILTVGAALQDIYLIDHDDLQPTTIGSEAILGKILVGSKIEIDKIAYEVGGSGLNAAVSFARHGHETILMSNLGKDTASDAILSILDKENIDSSYINYPPRIQTGTSVVLLDSKSGERTCLTVPGSSKIFDTFDVYDIDMINPDWVYVSTLFGDFQTLQKIFDRAKKSGAKIMFNPGEDELKEPKKLINLFKYIDIIIVNKKEAAKIVPGTVLSELASHLNNYIETVIITDAGMGGIASNRKETYRFGIYEDVKVKDTTGAGDAFGAGFLAHYASGKSFRNALVFASANSSSVISKIGGNSGILTGNEQFHPMPIQKI